MMCSIPIIKGKPARLSACRVAYLFFGRFSRLRLRRRKFFRKRTRRQPRAGFGKDYRANCDRRDARYKNVNPTNLKLSFIKPGSLFLCQKNA